MLAAAGFEDYEPAADHGPIVGWPGALIYTSTPMRLTELEMGSALWEIGRPKTRKPTG